MTPALDLLSLLIIGFLAIGVLSANIGPGPRRLEAARTRSAEAEDAAAQGRRRVLDLRAEYKALVKEEKRLNAQLPPGFWTRNLISEIERLRAAIGVTEETAAEATESSAVLTQDLAGLRESLDGFAAKEAELRELAVDLEERDRGVTRLQTELQDQRTKLAELQAALVDAGKDRWGFSSGAPLVRTGRTPTVTYFVVLSAGRVLPMQQPYFSGRQNPDGSTTIWPVQNGVTIEQAVRADSVVMKEIRTPTFRAGGRLNMLVMPDSFATFRTLRDVVIRERIDFGWEPIQSTTVGLGSGSSSRTIHSQAPR